MQRWSRHSRSKPASRTTQFLPAAATPPAKTSNLVYELNLRRQENWPIPSGGARYERNNLTFFEAGYLYQRARNVVAGLNIDGKAYPLTCPTQVMSCQEGTPITPATVTSMVAPPPPPNSTAIPIYKTFSQQGAYWLGLLTQNLTGSAKTVKITYQGITYGNFFAYGPTGTSPALTRYAAELGNSIQVQLWGNISVGPSYNIFWFQDQYHGAGDNLTRGAWNLSLNYLFDWHQGMEWKYALAGKTSQ